MLYVMLTVGLRVMYRNKVLKNCVQLIKVTWLKISLNRQSTYTTCIYYIRRVDMLYVHSIYAEYIYSTYIHCTYIVYTQNIKYITLILLEAPGDTPKETVFCVLAMQKVRNMELNSKYSTLLQPHH